MALLDPRVEYGPFEYPKAYEYWMQQHQAHWLHTEFPMSQDVHDYHAVLTDAERNVVSNILKVFTQTELFIEDYWSSKVARWFKKPEIQMMAHTFGAFESIHSVSYQHLTDTLGLADYKAFLTVPEAKAKIDRLINQKGKSKEEIALSLAVFSAFNEGVNLFSSFAVLMNFSRFNKLKSLGSIISASIRDESLHSEAGCWLFRTFISEYQEVWTDDLKKQVYDSARLTVDLEDSFIDKVFELGPIEGLDPKDLKNYIRFRANTKLQDLGLKSNWKNIDKESLRRMEWFDALSSGVNHSDFFAQRVVDYTKGSIDFSKIW
ncbi:MAG: ribonucleotide-diphosphate reductase subunit beta [Candidatus Bilamarchaeaceae archaeon]